MAVSSCSNFPSFFSCFPSCSTFSSLRDRTVSAALTTFRLLAASAVVAASSFMALSGWKGIAVLGGSYLILSLVRYLLVRALQRMPALDLAVRVSLWGTLILGGVAMGGAVGLFMQGGSLLSTGLQAKEILTIFQALGIFTGTLGYIFPRIKPLLSYPFFNQAYNQRYEERWEEMVQRVVARGILLEGNGGVALAGQGHLVDWGVLMQTAGEYPPDQLENLFMQNLHRSNKELSDLIESCSTVLTLDFLKRRLLPQRWSELIEKRLDPVLRRLEEIRQEFKSLGDLSTNEKLQPSLYPTVNQLFSNLKAEENDIQKFLDYLKENSSHEDFEFFDEMARSALEQQKALESSVYQVLSKIAALDVSDEEEEAYEALGAVPVCVADFRKLGRALGLPDEDKLASNPIGYVCEKIGSHGLSTKADLDRAGILTAAGENEKLSRTTLVCKRVWEHCGGKDLALFSQFFEECSHGQEAFVPPAMDRLAWILPAIETVFNRALAATLVTMQVIYHLDATAVGFAVGLIASFSETLVDLSKRFPISWINMHSVYTRETELSYRDKSFADNMVGLYWRISSFTFTVFFGKQGAFLAGMRHAYAAREIAAHWIRREVAR